MHLCRENRAYGGAKRDFPLFKGWGTRQKFLPGGEF